MMTTTRLLGALLLSLAACQSPAPPPAAPPVVASADKPSPLPSASASIAPAPTPPPPAAGPPATVLYLEGPSPLDLRVHRITKGRPPVKLPFTVGMLGEGFIHVGRDTPALSPDGAWLAFGRRGRLFLAKTDGSAPPEAITRFTRGGVRLLLAGFSPDGKHLLFHHDKLQRDDVDIPLPPGFVEGFHLLHLEGRKVERIPRLGGFDVWDDDSRHVIHVAEEGRKYLLVRADTRGEAPTTLQETSVAWGFGQLARCGGEITYVLDSQMIRGKASGGGGPVAPRGRFAEYQFPRCSPSGAHVLYRHKPGPGPNGPELLSVALRGAATPFAALECPGGCGGAAWESDEAVLAIDRGVLYRVGLDGRKTMIANQVTDVVAY